MLFEEFLAFKPGKQHTDIKNLYFYLSIFKNVYYLLNRPEQWEIVPVHWVNIYLIQNISQGNTGVSCENSYIRNGIGIWIAKMNMALCN